MQIRLLDKQYSIYTEYINDVKNSLDEASNVNSTLILGDRGVGKTTLLKNIFNTLDVDKNVKDKYVIKFLPFTFKISELDKLIDSTIISSNFSLEKNHYILFIDDLHFFIQESDKQAEMLRKVLLRKSPSISIIATADNRFKERLTHDKSLYGFFRIVDLEALTDKSLSLIMEDTFNSKTWLDLNKYLSIGNSFWFLAITSMNPRLVTILKNIIDSKKNQSVDPAEFLETYYDLVGPIFLNEMMSLSPSSRSILEGASNLGKEFHLIDVNVNLKNISKEAIRLVNYGYLQKKERGVYEFKNSSLKCWFRYVKNFPFGRVLNPDIPISLI